MHFVAAFSANWPFISIAQLDIRQNDLFVLGVDRLNDPLGAALGDLRFIQV